MAGITEEVVFELLWKHCIASDWTLSSLLKVKGEFEAVRPKAGARA